jgi:hypothetical protein
LGDANGVKMNKVDWRRVEDNYYTATVDGSLLELEHSEAGGWHLYSPLVDHDGVGYLGQDLHSAAHIVVALLSAKYRVDGWTINGSKAAGLPWGSPSAYAALDDIETTDGR